MALLDIVFDRSYGNEIIFEVPPHSYNGTLNDIVALEKTLQMTPVVEIPQSPPTKPEVFYIQ